MIYSCEAQLKSGLFQLILVRVYLRRGTTQTRLRDRLRMQNNTDLLADTNVEVYGVTFYSGDMWETRNFQSSQIDRQRPGKKASDWAISKLFFYCVV